jgi:hypothetical protein
MLSVISAIIYLQHIIFNVVSLNGMCWFYVPLYYGLHDDGGLLLKHVGEDFTCMNEL